VEVASPARIPSTLAIDHVIDHVYAAKDGYRQTSSEGGAGDLSAGEKTLAYFSFEDSKFGGVLHIPYYGKDGSSYGDWDLTLKVK
jgi:hypothetical protein